MTQTPKEIQSIEVDIPEFKEVFVTASYYNNIDPYLITHTDQSSAVRYQAENDQKFGNTVKIFKIKVPYKIEE